MYNITLFDKKIQSFFNHLHKKIIFCVNIILDVIRHMKKIEFSINDGTIYINYKLEDNVIKNFNNTNIISEDDLIFDIKYLKNNVSLVAGFLNVLIRNENITKAVICDKDLISLGFELINYIPSVKYLTIEPNVDIDYKMHLEILKNDTLKEINCYSIPAYLLERIDTTKPVKITTRSEVFFVSRFTSLNKLNSYSNIFYKKKVVIDYGFNRTDFRDFEAFLDINTHLKVIYFECISVDFVKEIISLLKKYGKSDIKIGIKGIPENLRYFEELEGFIKKNQYIKKNKIQFRIDYGLEYQKENFLKLLNFTTLKYILVATIIACAAGYGINQYDLYVSSKKINDINEEIGELLEEFIDYDNPVVPDEEPAIPPENTEPEQSTTTPPSQSTTPPQNPAGNSGGASGGGYEYPYYKNYPKVISVLKQTNPDTVGWLTVKNTTVNYPVVQSSNNSYYLTHDFNRHSNTLGWIYMDYRNNAQELGRNTIIYGHNLAKDKLMFGNLSATLQESWYKNEANHIITFNTEKADMQWKVFSIYKVPLTSDYLFTEFSTDEEFVSFANSLKSRSVYDFGVTINDDDKILTLSTCQNSGKNRLVVHAVLVK